MRTGDFLKKVFGIEPEDRFYDFRTKRGSIWGCHPNADFYSEEDLPDHIAAVEIGDIPTGKETRSEVSSDIAFIYREMKRTWLLPSGETEVEIHEVKDRIETSPELEGHDICWYCGTDNGPNGEDRMGFDCCFCGSN
ncbi:MAG: hypothetical protein GXP63_02315 [DPANN group archaeon]|nr:hypothetical protein [DPANN group archaeon]